MKETSVVVGMVTVAVVLGVFIFLFGGSEAPRPEVASESNNRQSAALVPFTEIMRGSQAKVIKRVNYLVTSSSGLEALWKMIGATSTPPVIDFSTTAVIAVFAGKVPAVSSGIAVARIEDSDARMVSITLALPEDTCKPSKSAVSAPYQIVTMPTTSLPLEHTDQITSISCS